MINKITEAEINNIESNSVLALPNDPTGAGYKAERIKHAFIDPITGKTGSIVSVINRLIDNINAEPGSVTISDSEPTETVKGDVWVNFDGKVKVYNGSAWENKLDIVTSNELETQVSNINSALNNKASIPDVASINSKIPAQASINNKLADKAFVNSSVATATATFQGTYTDIADLPTEGVDLNDYAFVSGVEDGNAYYDRYKYTGSEWKKEYRLNNSSFTAEQWAAINSGITSGKISEINNLIVGLSFSKADKDSVYTKSETLDEINEKVSQRLDALGAEQVVNKTTAISADSTDTQYPSAKAVYTLTNAIEKKVDENTKDINSLKAIVSNTVVTDTEVSDKYHTRKTADSLSIIDGAQTRVSKISGNTISSENFSGLKNAGFKSILSTGKNLVNTDGLFSVGTVYNGLTCSKNADGTYKLSGTMGSQHYWYGVQQTSTACYIPQGATIYFTPFFNITTTATGTNKVIGLALYDKDGGLVQQWNSGISSGTVTSFVATRDIVKVAFVWNISGSTGLAVTIDNIKFMLSYENTNVFEPYKSDGIACESNLELAEFDYAVPSENKVYRQSETITFDGTESGWDVDTAHGYSNLFRFSGYASDKIPFTDSSSINAISNKYQSVTRANKWSDYDSFVVSSYINKITIKDTSVSTAEEFKAKLAAWASEGKPLTVTYKKQSTTTEDVSFDKADYTAYLNGSESVMQGDNNTGDYGAECTVDQNFYVKNEV